MKPPPSQERLAEPPAIDGVQQRNYVRIQSARPAIVYGSGNSGEHRSSTVDVSGGGLLLAGADDLEIGEELTFQLTLTPGAAPVSGTARVVRVDPIGRRAVAFETISDLDRRRLVRFIFELQRDEHGRAPKS